MADLVIPDVPDDVLAVIDRRAGGLGLSRTEYLRRQLSGRSDADVTAADLEQLSDTVRDLHDPDVTAQAWSSGS